MPSFQCLVVFFIWLPLFSLCAPTPPDPKHALLPGNGTKLEDIPQMGGGLSASTIGCTLTSILIFGPPKSVVEDSFDNILAHIQKTKQDIHNAFSELRSNFDGVTKTPAPKTMLKLAETPAKIPKECLGLQNRTIDHEFQEIQDKTKNLFNEILGQIKNITSEVLKEKLKNSSYITHLHREIHDYDALIELTLSNKTGVIYLPIIASRCKHPHYGINDLAHRYEQLLIKDCETNKECYVNTIKKALTFDKKVGEEFLRIVALDAVQIQHVSIFCDGIVDDSGENILKTKFLDEHTKILEDTLKEVKKRLGI